MPFGSCPSYPQLAQENAALRDSGSTLRQVPDPDEVVRHKLRYCGARTGTDRRAGIDDAGVLDRFHEVAIHDAWVPYDRSAPYDTYRDARHQLCTVHALARRLLDRQDDKISGCLRTLAGANFSTRSLRRSQMQTRTARIVSCR